MRYLFKSLLFVVLVAYLITPGCASLEPARTDQYTPVQVAFLSSLPAFCGSESVSLSPMIKLTNPNPYPVAVDFSYSLFANGEGLGYSQLPRLYIPANGNVTARDTITISWFNLFAGKLFGSSMTPKVCAGHLLPIWKGIGGNTPAKVKKEVWEKISAANVIFVMDSELIVQDGGKTSNSFEKLTWSES